MTPYSVREEPFPAKTKSVQGPVGGINTSVVTVAFSDKLVITIAQDGSLNHWIHVPLAQPLDHHPPVPDSASAEDGNDIPLPHLTAVTLLGGTIESRATIGQLLATRIASTISIRNPLDSRGVVVGMGLRRESMQREEFQEMLKLVENCL